MVPRLVRFSLTLAWQQAMMQLLLHDLLNMWISSFRPPRPGFKSSTDPCGVVTCLSLLCPAGVGAASLVQRNAYMLFSVCDQLMQASKRCHAQNTYVCMLSHC